MRNQLSKAVLGLLGLVAVSAQNSFEVYDSNTKTITVPLEEVSKEHIEQLRKRVGQNAGEFYVQLQNKDNKYYSSKFNFGSNAQDINLVYDTQTDWTIVLAKECPNSQCSSQTDRYDRTTSTSTSKSAVVQDSIPFGDGGLLKGRTTTDLTCLVTPDRLRSCVEQGFTFFEVTSVENIKLANQYSGIVGIAPDDPSNGPSFIAKLKNDGYIDNKMVGIIMKKNPSTSYATYGGMSEFMMYKEDGVARVHYYPSTDSKRWKLKVHDIMVRDAGDNAQTFTRIDDQSVGIHFAEGTVDTFYRAVLIPTILFDNFQKMIHKSFNTTGILQGRVFCNDSDTQGNCFVRNAKCDAVRSGFRDVVIELEEQKGFIMTPDDYLIDVSADKVDFCSILIQRNNIKGMSNEYVLGAAFLYNYYQVYDFDNKRIGFNGQIVDFNPNRDAKGFPVWIIIVVLVVVAIVAVSIFVIIKIRNRKLQQQLGGETKYSQMAL